MEVKIGTNGVHWSQSTIVPHSHSSPQTLASTVSSSLRKRSLSERCLVWRRCPNRSDRSSLFGTSSSSSRLYRSRSCEFPDSCAVRQHRKACGASFDASSFHEFSSQIQELALKSQYASDGDDRNSEAGDGESDVYEQGSIRRKACSASFDASSLHEFSSQIQELALKSQYPSDGDDLNSEAGDGESDVYEQGSLRGDGCHGFNDEVFTGRGSFSFLEDRRPFRAIDPAKPPCPEIYQDLAGSRETEYIPVSIEQKANNVDLPASLRVMRWKKEWEEDLREAGGSAYCSIKKAFSSMVFIIRELHSYTMHMREILFYEDLQGIVASVQKEMHVSFVWIFQKVFSHTPMLMVSLMILLTNFTVHSMTRHDAIAGALPSGTCAVSVESASSLLHTEEQSPEHFDSSAIKGFTVPSSSGKAAAVGGNGGGWKFRPLASGSGGLNSAEDRWTRLGDRSSQAFSLGKEDLISEQASGEEELSLWNSIGEEAMKMHGSVGDGALDHETKRGLVSPVSAQMESDDDPNYFRTELLYQTALTHDPDNPLLLANFAQFLCVVPHDYDRAEEYFKRAAGAEPPDAEALCKYAHFLWRVRKDLWAAEETYLGAIEVDPTNSFYAADYAHFLWSTGGEDTCFPLDSPST